MPRAKPADRYKAPGQRALEDVQEYDRLERTFQLEKAMREALPDVGTGAPLIERLHKFQQNLLSKPRSAVSLTLALETQMTLAELEKELAMKRGKVIDWLVAGFTAKMREWQDERDRMEEEFQRVTGRKKARDRRDDDDDEDDE